MRTKNVTKKNIIILVTLLFFMSLAASAFAAHLDSITPSAGFPGTSVNIRGTGFGSVQGMVKFGTAVATVTGWSNLSIMCIVPTLPAGPYNVTVTTSGGILSDNAATFYVYRYPHLISISPNGSPRGTTVVISGENFGAATGTVKFGAVFAVVTNWSDTSITCNVPPITPGSYNVTVTTYTGIASDNALTFNVTLDGEIISYSIPRHARTGDDVTLSVTIKNTAFSYMSYIPEFKILKAGQSTPVSVFAQNQVILAPGEVGVFDVIWTPQDEGTYTVSYGTAISSPVYVYDPDDWCSTVPYIIITSRAMRDAPCNYRLQDIQFARHLENAGLPAKILTIEDDIDPVYSGSDLMAKIKSCLQDYAQNNGTKFALLAGDRTVIPTEDGQQVTGSLWSAFSDSSYAAYMYIGRAPIVGAGDLNNFVKKTIDYQLTTDTSFLSKVRMLGEGWTRDTTTIPNRYLPLLLPLLNRVENGYAGNIGFKTAGYAHAPFFNVQTLCDADVNHPGPNNVQWTPLELENIINANVHIINHLGYDNPYFYSDPTYDPNYYTYLGRYYMRHYASDLAIKFTNTKGFFLFSIGGAAGNLMYQDGFIKTLMNMDKGAFAAVVAQQAPSLTSSLNSLNQFFWDAVLGKRMTKIGAALSDAKSRIAGAVNYPAYKGVNLFGDPGLDIKVLDQPRVDIVYGLQYLDQAVPVNWMSAEPGTTYAGWNARFDIEIKPVGMNLYPGPNIDPATGAGRAHSYVRGYLTINDPYITVDYNACEIMCFWGYKLQNGGWVGTPDIIPDGGKGAGNTSHGVSISVSKNCPIDYVAKGVFELKCDPGTNNNFSKKYDIFIRVGAPVPKPKLFKIDPLIDWTNLQNPVGYMGLRWTDNCIDERGYRIERKIEDADTAGLISGWTTVYDSQAPNAVSYEDINVPLQKTRNQRCTYKIYPYNMFGSFGDAFTYLTARLADAAAVADRAPALPSSLSATLTAYNQVQLTWQMGTGTASGVFIERSRNGIDGWAQVFATATSPYTDATVYPDTTYYYRVRSYLQVNALNVSAYTALATVSTRKIRPGIPGTLKAIGVSTSRIDLSWIDNANDASGNEDGYIIERTADHITWTEIGRTVANITAYSDTSNLTPNGLYYYRVWAFNSVGRSVVPSLEASARAAMQPPAKPVLTAMALSALEVYLSWQEDSPNVTGYTVTRTEANNGQIKATFTIAGDFKLYDDLTPNPNTYYFYVVKATNTAGNSPDSDPVYVQTPILNRPNTPSGFMGTALSGSAVLLTWTDTSDNETGFKVWRNGPSGYALIATTAPNATVYTDAGLSSATAYSYKLTSTNRAGDSFSFVLANATTLAAPPQAPANLSANLITGSQLQIRLAWQDTSSDESGFKIERLVNSSWVEIGSATANATAYDDTGLLQMTMYTYRVRAYNACGVSDYTNTSSATTTLLNPGGMPYISGIDQFVKPYDTIHVSGIYFGNKNGSSAVIFGNDFIVPGQMVWSDGYITCQVPNRSGKVDVYVNTSRGRSNVVSIIVDGPGALPAAPYNFTATAPNASRVDLRWQEISSGITAFKIERSLDTVTWSEVVLTTGGTSGVDMTVAANTRYFYRMRALNATGSSPYTDYISVTTPNGVTVPTAPTNLTWNCTDRSVTIRWQDNSSNETGFKLLRYINAGYQVVGTVGANVTSCTDTGLIPATNYQFTVCATNAYGDSSQAPSITVRTGTVLQPPAPPSALAATSAVTPSSIAMIWTDNSSNEGGFKLERSLDQVIWVPIATLTANITTYTDRGLLTATTYYYRIRATNGAGDSLYSNTLTQKTVIQPHLTAISPTSGLAGTNACITGTNFGPIQGTVQFGTALAVVTSWSATSIACTVPAISAGSCGVTVTNNAGTASDNMVAFTVTTPPPHINAISPSSGIGGTNVTISGTSFGSIQGLGLISGITAVVTSWSDTSIVFSVSNISAGSYSVRVRTNAGILSDNAVTFTVTLRPHVTAMSSSSGIIGSSVTISGTSFGSDQGKVIFGYNQGGTTSAAVTSWSNTSIVCVVPGVAVGSYTVSVNNNAGITSDNAVTFTVTLPVPHIDALSPISCQPGTSVTITGTGFGSVRGTVNIFTITAVVTSWSDTSISFTVPNLSDGSYPVYVRTNGGFSNPGTFTIRPYLSAISPTSGIAGISATILGTTFGSANPGTVKFGTTSAAVTSWSDTSIVCVVPCITAGLCNVTVTTAAGYVSDNVVTFTVISPPDLNVISPTSGLAGTSATISGANFGSKDANCLVTFRNKFTADTGTAVTTNWQNTAITATVPNLPGGYYYVTVTTSAGASNTALFKLLGAPSAVGTITPASGSSNANQQVFFTTTYTSPYGADAISLGDLRVCEATSAKNCFIGYYNATTGMLGMLADDGISGLPMEYAPGTAAMIENSYAKLDCSKTTVTKSGTTMTVIWAVTFKPAFAGKTYVTWLVMRDDNLVWDGWREKGAWTVVNQTPQAGTISPLGGSSLAGTVAVFIATSSDPDGYQDISHQFLLISPAASPAGVTANAVYLGYNTIENKIYMGGDDGATWLGGWAPGSAHIIENSQAMLDCSTIPVPTGSGNALSVTWKVTFKPGYTGLKNAYLVTNDKHNASSGCGFLGTWTVSPAYTLAITAANGTVTRSPDAEAYAAGQVVTLTATPNTGYSFGSWSGAVTGTANPGTIIMDASKTVTANFGFPITATGGVHGTITPLGSTSVTPGGSQTYTITPATGYTIDLVTVDGTLHPNLQTTDFISGTYTFTNVTAPHTINATFSVSNFIITASAGAHGSISPNGSKCLTYGSSQTYTIAPTAGYDIQDVLVDDISVGAVATYSFNNVTRSHDITATFIAAPPALPAAPSNVGGIALSKTSVRVTWVDNSNGRVPFKIYVYNFTTYTWQCIGSVAAGVTSYTVNGLSPGTGKYYLVSSVNATGESYDLRYTYLSTPA